ncbi:MAG: HxsD-like protein [Nanoarchaeota archaeon]|nr:HxsD-like protein [Nanoarchaeota archaeon]
MADMQIDKKNREVKIVLDTVFYGYGAILQAGKDYLEHAWVFIDGDVNDKVLVTMKPKKDDLDVETIGYEFCNYVLGLMQNAIY